MFYFKLHGMFTYVRGNSLVRPFLSSNAVPWNLQLQTEAVLHPFDINGNPEPAPSLPPSLLSRFRIFGTPPDNANGLVPASDYIYSRRPVGGFRGLLPGSTFNVYSGSYRK